MSDGSFFHANCSTVKRSEGRNAVATAAYCAGMSLYDATERTTHDYSRKRGVVEAFVTTPEGKPGLEWAHDIAALSNAMEAHEKRKDSQVGHQWRVALPSELDESQRSALTHAMAQRLSDLYGVGVIAGIHLPDEHGDQRNFHAHLLFTTRKVEEAGLGAKVTVITDPKTSAAEVTRFRNVAADLTNEALESAGSDTRVSALSYAARGIEKEPTIHLGPSASALERHGEGSDRGDINAAIIADRIAEQEKLSAAIARQFEGPPEELTLETERELARRFGEEWREVKADDATALPLDGNAVWRPEQACDDVAVAMQPEVARVAATGTTHASSAIHRWMQARARAFLLLWKSESGAPERREDLTPERAGEGSPVPDAEIPPDTAEGRSWVSRVWDAGRQALQSWQQRGGADAAEPTSFAQRVAQGPSPENAGDDAGPGGKVEPPGPETLPPEAEGRAMSAFDVLTASMDADSSPPHAQGVSAFDAVTAEQSGPVPVRAPAPEPPHPTPEP